LNRVKKNVDLNPIDMIIQNKEFCLLVGLSILGTFEKENQLKNVEKN
jgi:hypothetical protein